ncbi:MAG TPA: type II secretion system F family protein [Verrucomicrobiae bacterium]|nr:type II secretion system F family protein [Verrucomicrobiae bacterium]
MMLRARDKADLYEQLAGLLEAGVPISRAVGMLRDRMARGAARSAIGHCSARMSKGETLSAAMLAEPRAWEAFESSVVAAGEEAGRLVPLARELGRYWRKMDETRRRILAGLVYPLLILHVAILAGSVPAAVAGGMGAYTRVVVVSLGVLYAMLWFLWELGNSAAGMLLCSHLPVVGTARSSLRGLRFALCLRLQVEAGIPILTALPRAARAAGGVSLGSRADAAVSRLRTGEPVAEVLPTLFAEDQRLTSLLATGVESGRIVGVLRAIEEDAAARWGESMALLQVWLPRMVYFAAMAFAVWQVARLAAGVYGAYGEAASLEW